MCRVIDLVKSGKNIKRLLSERGLNARDVQQRLGFAERRPVYFWIQGKNLPFIDNLFMLSPLYLQYRFFQALSLLLVFFHQMRYNWIITQCKE